MFQLSNKCWICDKLFDLVDEKVRDHCHISGKFRGAAHFSCNANLKISKKIPVIVFIDSMQFMNSSLDSLVKNLVNGDFKYLSE